MIPITDITKKSPESALKIALIQGEKKWTYHELHEASDHIAANLLINGYQHGDRILICLENGFEIAVSVLACFKIGLIIVQSHPDFSAAELSYIAENSGFRGIISSRSLYLKLKQLQGMHSVYLTDLREAEGKVQPFHNLLRKPERPLPSLRIDPKQPILISYTSGTTAKRKGVIHTYHSIETTMKSVLKTFGPEIFERPLIFSSMGNNGMIMVFLLPAFWLDGTLILGLSPKVEVILEVIDKERPTFFFSFPFYLKQLIHHPNAQKVDFRSVKLILVGGDIVTRELCDEFLAIAKVPLRQGFGMTESHCVFANLSDDPTKLGSMGHPGYGIEVKIIDDQGQSVPHDVIGQLAVKWEGNTIGYWNFPDETKKALHEGWLYTGDLAMQDRDGFFWFKGRIKNIITRLNRHISPIEVEEEICRHPAVRGAGVIGIPDKEFGQAVKAFVELKPEKKVTASELRHFLKDLLAPHKIPTEIAFVEKIPRTLTGKVDRKALESL